MGYSTKELWDLTPRQFKAQLDVHKDIKDRLNGAEPNKAREEFMYIDQIPGW